MTEIPEETGSEQISVRLDAHRVKVWRDALTGARLKQKAGMELVIDALETGAIDLLDLQIQVIRRKSAKQ